jgi:hypothetical protein
MPSGILIFPIPYGWSVRDNDVHGIGVLLLAGAEILRLQ